MTRLDAIRGHLDMMKREHDSMAALYRKDVAWLVEMVDAFRQAAELVGHASHEDGCNMCAAVARLEAPDA